MKIHVGSELVAASDYSVFEYGVRKTCVFARKCLFSIKVIAVRSQCWNGTVYPTFGPWYITALGSGL